MSIEVPPNGFKVPNNEAAVAVILGYANMIAFPQQEVQLRIHPDSEEDLSLDDAYILGKELGAISLIGSKEDKNEPIA